MATFPCLGPPHVSLCILLGLGATWLGHVTQGARVLLVPLPETSECRQMVSIGRVLHSRGHQVILFVPDYFRVRRCTEPIPPGDDMEIRTFDTAQETTESVKSKLEKLNFEVMAGGTGLLGGSSSSRAAMQEICNSYMESKVELDTIRRGGRVDIVILDGSPVAHCLTLLPAYIGSPFVAVGSFIHPYDSSSPLPTAFYPAPLSGLSGNLGLWQRLSNFLTYAGHAWWTGEPLWGGFHQGNALGPRVSRLNHDQLIRKAALYLENSDYVVDYPKATFPNFVQVGGLTAGPAKPLPRALAKMFEDAGDDGVIIVSLGPHVFQPNQNVEDKLLTAFRKLDSRILLRLNASSKAMSRVRNVQTVSWFPQNDALGMPNTKLFVSHCGQNSFYEALYHGVPLLCCHFSGSDMLGTGLKVAEYGVGLTIDLFSASADALQNAITTLLADRSFTRRAKAASLLYRSRPITASQRAANAIEHVMKHGGGYLRPRMVEMSFFQYSGLDVALALFTLVLGSAGLLCVLVSKYLPEENGHDARGVHPAPGDKSGGGGGGGEGSKSSSNTLQSGDQHTPTESALHFVPRRSNYETGLKTKLTPVLLLVVLLLFYLWV